MQKSDFSNKEYKETFYDIREDWALIESSLAKQYGIRIRNEKGMSFSEFSHLVSGLMSDTPLGQIVGIRAEKDKNTIKNFTPDQRQIYTDWRRKQAEKLMENTEKLDNDMDNLYKMLGSMFGGKEVKK